MTNHHNQPHSAKDRVAHYREQWAMLEASGIRGLIHLGLSEAEAKVAMQSHVRAVKGKRFPEFQTMLAAAMWQYPALYGPKVESKFGAK